MTEIIETTTAPTVPADQPDGESAPREYRPRRRRKRPRYETIRLTARDTKTLEWISQQRGVSLDVLAELLGKSGEPLSQARAYEISLRWEEVGRVTVEPVDDGSGPGTGLLWVVPTPAWARTYLGWDTTPAQWVPKASTAAHHRACNEVRMLTTGLDTNPYHWRSERLLTPQVRKDGQHLHDAWVTDNEGDTWAVEVELSRKAGAGRLEKVVGEVAAAAGFYGLAGVMYFVRGQALHREVEATAKAVITAHNREHDRHLGLDVRDLDVYLADKRAARRALRAGQQERAS